MVGRDRADAQQLPAAGPGRERRGIDPGRRDVHAGGVEPVRGDEPAGRPRAGGHDGVDGVQDLPLGRGEIGGLLPQRQVHEHDQRQPPRLRDDDVGHPAGDEPVEEHGGTVGQRGQCPGQLGAGGRPRAAATRPARRSPVPPRRSSRQTRRS